MFVRHLLNPVPFIVVLAIPAAIPHIAIAAEFQTGFPDDIQRTWIGEHFFANRMLDWRVANGRLECLEGSTAKPMRTAHVLTHRASSKRAGFTATVRVGAINPSGLEPAEEPIENSWAGFLIGVGGNHVDVRTSALCHHWPGHDGGLIVALDAQGRIVFRDNAHDQSRRGPAGNFGIETWPLLAHGDFQIGGPEFELRLRVTPTGDAYRVELAIHGTESPALLARGALENVDPALVDGNIALVSHTSPSGNGPGYWFDDLTISGDKIAPHPTDSFGPIVSAQHTLSEGLLKMTAQMVPLGARDTQEVYLETLEDTQWTTRDVAVIAPHSYTATFRIDNWDPTHPHPYRIAYRLRTGLDAAEWRHYYGTVRAERTERDEIVIAAFTGQHISAQGQGHWNGDHFWHPHNELVAAVKYWNPDFLFFSGDQIYEGGLAGIVREPSEDAVIDYLYHWYRWCWAFRDLTRDVPSVAIPDDHDVYQGNIWGAGGKKARDDGDQKTQQDSGGYTMDPLFVNTVHRTQTSHLPDPYDPAPIEQSITTYHTRVEYAGVSFAVLADRMWKSSPTVMVPEGNVINGWFEKRGFDILSKSDAPGAVLLGERQLAFLEEWAADWRSGAEMKVVLSQTIFANVATLPADAINDTVVPGMRQPEFPGEYMEGDAIVADADSNAWPPSGRNRALRVIRKAFPLHVAGDQHLGSFIQYGVDNWGDAPFALCVPSVANVWPRRWFPPEPGLRRAPDMPRYTGDYLDGFGNKMTVYAVSNPGPSGHEPAALYDRAPGFGLVRINKTDRTFRTELWPRWVMPWEPDARMYPGWPITVDQSANYGRKPIAHLPRIEVTGLDKPVIRVVNETTGELVYALRIREHEFTPWIFDDAPNTIHVGDPDSPVWKTLRGITPETGGPLRVTFDAE